MKATKLHIVLAVGLLLTLAIPAFAFALTPAEVYRRTSDAVVLILASHDRGGRSKGTGSVVAPGRVLTNAHVVFREEEEDRSFLDLAEEMDFDCWGISEHHAVEQVATVSAPELLHGVVAYQTSRIKIRSM